MPNKNNSKLISEAKPHTVKKFELIEKYITEWAQKLMNNDSCTGIIFIDCMCNSGLYTDVDGKQVYGTPIRVANILADVAASYPHKQVELYFNDKNKDKIAVLEQKMPERKSNFKYVLKHIDGNDLIRWIGDQLKSTGHMHYFLLYDPYEASINWDALKPFFKNWGEVLINHMISDTIRAVSQVKREESIKKYQETYQAEALSKIIPYGSDRSSYENRIVEIINKLKGSPNREYYVATFPFFNRKNSLVYDLVHCTSNIEGFRLFKKSAWKTFDGKSSIKSGNKSAQLALNFDEDAECSSEADEYCYTLEDVADYIQVHFKGLKNVPYDDVWAILDSHPIFPYNGFRQEIKKILRNTYGAKPHLSTIDFQ